jgi:hypothetical protein
MLKRTLVIVCALLAASALVSSAGADTCWQLSPRGNIVKLRFLYVAPVPARFLIAGVEDVFADRAVNGSASFGVHDPNTLRLGFTDYAIDAAHTSHLECNASVALGTGNGTWTCWLDVTGTSASGDFVLVPGCVGVPGTDTGADLAAVR